MTTRSDEEYIRKMTETLDADNRYWRKVYWPERAENDDEDGSPQPD